MEAGGFLRENEEAEAQTDDTDTGGSLLPESGGEAEHDDFEIIGGSQDPKKKRLFAHVDADHEKVSKQMSTPISLQAMHEERGPGYDEGGCRVLSETSESGNEDPHGDDEDDEDPVPQNRNDNASSDQFELKSMSRSRSQKARKSRLTSTTAREARNVRSKPSRTTRSTRASGPTGSPYFSH